MRRNLPIFLLLIVLLFVYNNCAPSLQSSGDFKTINGSQSSTSPPNSGIYISGPVNGSGFRKLTNNELDSKVESIFKVTINSKDSFGDEQLNPFNNSVEDQVIDLLSVENIVSFSERLSQKILQTPPAKALVYVCQPTSSSDGECLTKIMTNLFRMNFVDQPEEETFDLIHNKLLSMAGTNNSFDVAINGLLNYTFQTHRFTHTGFGSGQFNRNSYKLSGMELAHKVSSLITGQTPDLELIELALSRQLENKYILISQINRLFSTSAASDQAYNFHSQWLGFYNEKLPAETAASANIETKTVLKEHLLDQGRPWAELLKLDYTYINDYLAGHYGFKKKNTNGFYKFNYSSTDQPRQGLFSQATFLSAYPSSGDSSPTRRGYHMIKHLLCDKESVGAIPENVDADELPQASNGGNCKSDRVLALSTVGACAGCHKKMDGIGNGLENFDNLGRYRVSEPGDASCSIKGEGEVFNMGRFKGVVGLSDLLFENQEVINDCLVEKMGEFAYGFSLKNDNSGYLKSLQTKYKVHRNYKSLITDIILSEEFQSIVWK